MKVSIVDYDPRWIELYERETKRIHVGQLEHVGSTAVPGLPAKPVIDMVLAVEDASDENAWMPALKAEGSGLKFREPDWFQHRLFKGPDTDTNLHVFSAGCPEIDRMLQFRDWLRQNAGDRELYGRTKLELARRDWPDIDSYAAAKSAVVTEIMKRAQAAAKKNVRA